MREHQPHEAPLTMTLPLIFLAAVTLVAGFIPFGKFVSSNGVEYVSHLDGSVAGVSILIACVAIAVATWFYAKGSSALPGKIAEGLGGFYKAAVHRFYIDEVYLFITRRLIFSGISSGIAWFDRHVVDGTMDLLATLTQRVAFGIRRLQSGQIQQYAFVFLAGTLVLVVLMIYCW